MIERDKIFEEIIKLFVYAGNRQGEDGYPTDVNPNSYFHVNEIQDRIRHYQKTGEVLTHHTHWCFLSDQKAHDAMVEKHRANGCNHFVGCGPL